MSDLERLRQAARLVNEARRTYHGDSWPHDVDAMLQTLGLRAACGTLERRTHGLPDDWALAIWLYEPPCCDFDPYDPDDVTPAALLICETTGYRLFSADSLDP